MFKDKKNKIIFFIGMIVLLLTTASLTYAYFQLTIIGNDDAKDMLVSTGTLDILYEDGRSLSLIEAFPGSEIYKVFTVTNTGSLDAEYDIMWKDVFNSFVDKGDLQFTLTCETNNEDGSCKEQNIYKQVPSSTNIQEMIKNISIIPGEVHTYKLTVYFLETNEDQNDNQGATLATNVQINGYTKPTLTMNITNGTLDKNNASVEYGSNETFEVTPEAGYSIEDISISCEENTTYSIVGNSITFGPVYLTDTCSINFVPIYRMTGYVVNQSNQAMVNSVVEVHSEPKTAITDNTGYFELNGIETGEHSILVNRNSSLIHNSSFNIVKGNSFNIAGNIVTAKINEPIKVKIRILDSSEKEIVEDTTYRVKVNAINATVEEGLIIVEKNGTINEDVNPIEGYDFTSLRCTNGVTGTYENNIFSINNVSSDTACMLGFGSEVYLLSMNSHSDHGVTMKSIAYNEPYGELPSVTKEYYDLDGWYTSEIGGSEVTSDTLVNISSDHTIHARWLPKDYEITYDCTTNGGTCNIENQTVAYGSDIDLTPIASKEGYEFLGWNTTPDSTTILNRIPLDSAGKIIYAIFSKTIDVTYEGNGSTLSKYSDTCTIFNNVTTCSFTSPTIIREGYETIGFNTNQTATTSQVNQLANYIVTNNTVYYAITIDTVLPRITLYTNENITYQRSQSVVVSINDEASGLQANQSIKYGWSTTNTVEPETYTTLNFSNTVGVLSKETTIINNELTGSYYLWVIPNNTICDMSNNCSTETVISSGVFNFDNSVPVIDNYDVNLSVNTITADINARDDESQIKYYYYGYTTGGTCEGITYFSSENDSYTFMDLGNASYLVCMYATNNLDMASEVVSKSLTINLQESYAYSTATEHTFRPSKNGYYKVELWGASSGSYGGYTSGYIYMSTNETYYIYIGGAGTSFNNSGTYNGGGGSSGGGYAAYNNGIYLYGASSNNSRPGGGATDIRYGGKTLYDRIMVAGGSGGNAVSATGTAGGGLQGYASNVTAGYQTSGYAFGQGGNGSSAGETCSYNMDLSYCSNTDAGGGGGGGYWGGRGGSRSSGAGAGGSSFISGHTGCVAVGATTGCAQGTSNNSCSIHSSGKEFNNTKMIDGMGFEWKTGKLGQTVIPNPAGGNFASGVGLYGNGYAKITFQSGLVTYDLSINLDGGSSNVSYKNKVMTGEEIVLVNPTKWGYTFDGWEIEGTGSTLNGNKLTIGTEAVSVTATWVERNVYDYAYSGSQKSFPVPRNGYYKVELWGASSGGYGGYTSGYIYMTEGETYYINVGQTPTGFSKNGTFNGGGAGSGGGEAEYNNGILIWGTDSNNSRPGGGATDIRFGGTSVYDRIMVAGGAGGNSQSATGASGGGLQGYSVSVTAGYQTSGYAFGQGGNGSSAGQTCNYNMDLSYCSDMDAGGGGGGGYWGGRGGSKSAGSGAGGSSFISGHTGCVAIESTDSSTAKSNCTQGTSNNSCSIHFSNKTFTDTIIIDGDGYNWTTTKNTQVAMPNPNGGTYTIGNGQSGNGYARLTHDRLYTP